MIGGGNILYGTPPGGRGNVIAPGFNNDNPQPGDIVIAAGTIRPVITGATVTWPFLNDGSHTFIFFTGTQVGTTAPNRVGVTYPNITKIISFIAAPDETFASFGVSLGASVFNNFADIQLSSWGATAKLLFVSDGTNWHLQTSTPLAAAMCTFSTTLGNIDILTVVQPNRIAFQYDPLQASGYFMSMLPSTSNFTVVPLYSAIPGVVRLASYTTGFVQQIPPSGAQMVVDLGLTIPYSIDAWSFQEPFIQDSLANIWIQAVFQV